LVATKGCWSGGIELMRSLLKVSLINTPIFPRSLGSKKRLFLSKSLGTVRSTKWVGDPGENSCSDTQNRIARLLIILISAFIKGVIEVDTFAV
jgi:hypothetical protein